MANGPRYNPVEDIFNELTRGFLVRPLSSVARGAMPQHDSIRLDVKEDERAYRVFAEIPGVRKEDIHVDIDGSHVSLHAEVRPEDEQPGEKTIYSERSHGLVRRGFDLPTEVDADAARAEYRDGVLRLTLPKKSGSGSRRVNIS